MKDALATASEARHAERVEELARTGGDPAYEEAAALIVRMGGLRGAAEQAAFVADIESASRAQAQFHEASGVMPMRRSAIEEQKQFHAEAPA